MENKIIIKCLCVIGSIFITGCSEKLGGQAMSSLKPFIINLNDNTEYQELLTGLPQTRGMRSGRVYLKPGETCGRHSTEKHEEMLVFLAGKGTALVGEDEMPIEVAEGKISYIPPYTIHNVKNTANEPLIYIYCVAPVQLSDKNSSTHTEHHH